MPEPSPPDTLHLRPTAPLAERVLLPGDPGRALALAQALLLAPRMFNHHRGLWGYTGATQEGVEITIQATGMGGPSAAIVVHELFVLGARAAVRIGTCGGLADGLELGDLVLASEAICADGTSRSIAGAGRVVADPALAGALARAAPGARIGPVVSVDLFYEEDGARGAALAGAHSDAVAVEMEAATLFALGARAGVPSACVLSVSDILLPDTQTRRRIDDEALLASAEAMGRAAIAALAAV